MMQGINKTAATTHRQTCYRAETLIAFDAVFLFYIWNQFFEKEIFVVPVAFRVIKITATTSIGIGHNDDHWGGIAFPDRLICYIQYFAKLYPAGLVVARAVQQVKYRVTSV